jgi:uridine kinase
MGDKIQVKIGGKTLAFPAGTTVGTVLAHLSETTTFPPLGAVDRNRLLDPELPLHEDCALSPVNYGDFAGMTVYRRTAVLILAAAAGQAFPGQRLIIGHTLANGYYCDLCLDRPLTSADVAKIEKEMCRIVKADLPIGRSLYSREEALDLFSGPEYADKRMLIENIPGEEVYLTACGEAYEIYIGPMAPSTGLIRTFNLTPYREGFILRFPPQSDIRRFPTWAKDWAAPIPQKAIKLFRIYRQCRSHSQSMGIENAGSLDQAIREGRASAVIMACEEAHRREIADLAANVLRRFPETCFIFLGGPLASGKSALARRLKDEIAKAGITILALSLDGYRRGDRDEGNAGECAGLEKFSSLDLPLLNTQIDALARGEEVQPPHFDRENSADGETLALGEKAVVLIEGTHALNEAIAPLLSLRAKFKIYVSALTQISIDDHTRLFTADTRLIRALARGWRDRSQDALTSLKRWPSIRQTENREVYPFQDKASVMFNSALIYEHAVLKNDAEAALRRIGPGNPEYLEAERLLSFLSFFLPLPAEEVPEDSLLREFLP